MFDDIVSVLLENGSLSARDLASRIGARTGQLVSKSEINSVLYSHVRVFEMDVTSRAWRVRETYLAKAVSNRTPRIEEPSPTHAENHEAASIHRETIRALQEGLDSAKAMVEDLKVQLGTAETDLTYAREARANAERQLALQVGTAAAGREQIRSEQATIRQLQDELKTSKAFTERIQFRLAAVEDNLKVAIDNGKNLATQVAELQSSLRSSEAELQSCLRASEDALLSRVDSYVETLLKVDSRLIRLSKTSSTPAAAEEIESVRRELFLVAERDFVKMAERRLLDLPDYSSLEFVEWSQNIESSLIEDEFELVNALRQYLKECRQSFLQLETWVLSSPPPISEKGFPLFAALARTVTTYRRQLALREMALVTIVGKRVAAWQAMLNKSEDYVTGLRGEMRGLSNQTFGLETDDIDSAPVDAATELAEAIVRIEDVQEVLEEAIRHYITPEESAELEDADD